MKYCTRCGQQLVDEAIVCTNCGCAVAPATPVTPVEPVTPLPSQDAGINIAVKVFLIIGTVVNSLLGFLIPLAWCLPMTISAFRRLNRGQRISTGFKVCTLLFVNTIAGILLLCKRDN